MVGTSNRNKGIKVFLTGATGFVGKVVLAELFRRQEELNLQEVFLLIRTGRKGQNPSDRFFKEIASSACFSKLDPSWRDRVRVVAGDLSADLCGIGEADLSILHQEVTHIINCAASVEFDLPVADAAAANITSALNVLSLAKRCSGLTSMVSVSTAYVTPHASDEASVPEVLVDLPWDPEEIYKSILAGDDQAQDWMRETGHPNTYTFTKCIAEHLLEQNREDVPLSIVRPSIISACMDTPFPGWIDSHAAFAGFVALIGAGQLRAIVANPHTTLDIVPCDVVSNRVIDVAMSPPKGKEMEVFHTTSGPGQNCEIQMCVDTIQDFFKSHRIGKTPNLTYIGPPNMGFKMRDIRYHRAPGMAATTLLGVVGQQKRRRFVKKLAGKVEYLNRSFPYFTHKTFRFETDEPLRDGNFDPKDYVNLVCTGVYRHLMQKNETEMILGGKSHREGHTDCL